MTSAGPAGGGPAETDRTMFTNFQAYVTPTEADYRHCFDQGLVVLDANVLLNLYRYSAATRRDFLAALNALRDRLFVPHQALVEFWRNREGVMRNPRGARQLLDDLRSNRSKSEAALRSWANRLSLSQEEVGPLYLGLGNAFDILLAEVERIEGREGHGEDVRTQDDQVLSALDVLLQGRVGGRLEDTAEREARKEAGRRMTEKVPPGYMDRSKTEGDAAGDYLVWCQLLEQAKSERADVLLVTGDEKDDWWRREAGRLRGPRPELVEEFQRQAGGRFFMLRPSSFLAHVTKIKDVDINPDSVDVVQRIGTYWASVDSTVDLLSLSATELERLVAQLLRAMYGGTVASGATSHRTVDFVVRDESLPGLDIPIGFNLRHALITEDYVIETAQRMLNSAVGRVVIIGIRGFTDQAIDYARSIGRIQLLSGPELCRLLKKHLDIDAVLGVNGEQWPGESSGEGPFEEG